MKNRAIKIRLEEIHFDFIRASGPGGQNVNKVASAVQLRFDARNSPSIKPEIRERLFRLAGNRLTSAGEIVIEAKKFRTQQRNREDALQRLLQLVDKAAVAPKIRRKSHPTAASKDQRLRRKKHRSAIKKLRSRASQED